MKRVSLQRKKRQSGMAMLVAIMTMTIMTVLITEITYISNMRLITAGNQRDRVQAYWLAKSGVGIYNLVLAANKELGNNSMIQQFGLGDSLWQMVPVLNTGLMRMLFVSEAPGSDVSDEAIETFKTDQVVSDEVMEASRRAKRNSVADGIVSAAREIAETTDIKAICCFTQTGTTALLTARERPRVPIIALSSEIETARRLALTWGTNCVLSGNKTRFKEAVVSAVRAALAEGLANETDQVVITAGVPFNITGTTNILRVAPCNERMIYAMDPE